MLTQIIKTPLCQVYVCPAKELNKQFPGDIVARLLYRDEVLVINWYNSHTHQDEKYFITPRELRK